MDSSPLITARQAAEVAGVSHSKINRDAASGKLTTAQRVPGYKGARLFTEADVKAAYAHELAEATS